MHGSIFAELQKFVTTNLGAEAWRTLIRESGVPTKIYLPIREYPDEELVALVSTASRITGTPVPKLLFDYGVFIAPDLLKMYRSYIRPEWRTLDVIEHTEEQIHVRVRVDHEGAAPPYLTATRLNPDEIMVHYISQRKLCAVAEGVAHGMAKHFDEKVETTQRTCMHRGDESCEILVRRIG